MNQRSTKSADGSIRVSWKTMPFVIVFCVILMVLMSAGPDVRRGLMKIIMWGAVGWTVLLLGWLGVVWVRGLRQMVALNKILPLLNAGKNQEACVMGLALRERYPRNSVLKLNLISAMHGAGRVEEARELLGQMDREKLSPILQKGYDDWRVKLRQNETV